MEPGLYIVGTPIGHLEDITLRAIQVLKAVDLILVEDTRNAGQLLKHHHIQTPMLSYHKFNEAKRSAQLIQRMKNNQALALISDSGMPVISDPGACLVQQCHKNNISVHVLPGPTAITSAIALSGWGGNGFVFEGFLPTKPGKRKNHLNAIKENPRTIVLYEAPHRMEKLLKELEENMPTRSLFVVRELTKRFEENITGTAREVRQHFHGRAFKGEFVVLLKDV